MEEPLDEELQDEPITFDLELLTAGARAALDIARSQAHAMGDPFIGTDHVLLGLACSNAGAAYRVLSTLQLSPDLLRDKMTFIRGGEPKPIENGSDPGFSPRLLRVMAFAAKEAAKRNQSEIGTLHVLSGLLREREGIAILLLESPGAGLGRTGSAIAAAHREGWSDANE